MIRTNNKTDSDADANANAMPMISMMTIKPGGKGAYSGRAHGSHSY